MRQEEGRKVPDLLDPLACENYNEYPSHVEAQLFHHDTLQLVLETEDDSPKRRI
jgi:hypothetical protein